MYERADLNAAEELRGYPEHFRRQVAILRCLIWQIGLLAISLSSAAAQVNTEPLRAVEDELGFSGGVGFDLSMRTGNVELIETGLRGRLDYVMQRVTTYVVGSKTIGWKGGGRFINEGFIAFREVFRRGATVRPEMFQQINHNEARLLDFRTILGFGLRTSIYRHRATHVWWGSAFLYEYERLDLEADAAHPQSTSVSRWSNYLSSRVVFNEQSMVFWTVYVQPQFDRPKDVRVLGEATLGAALSEVATLQLTLFMHYDSRPPDDKRPLDTRIRAGFGIEF